MESVFDIASFYLSKAPMTQKKLQKLVYYAYAWTLTLLNDKEDNLDNKLFNEEIQAWVHGPVCPSLYAKYKGYGWEAIPSEIYDVTNLEADVLDVLEQVWTVYGGFNGNELESISHQEMPWQMARVGYSANQPSNEQISDNIIYQYYSKRLED